MRAHERASRPRWPRPSSRARSPAPPSDLIRFSCNAKRTATGTLGLYRFAFAQSDFAVVLQSSSLRMCTFPCRRPPCGPVIATVSQPPRLPTVAAAISLHSVAPAEEPPAGAPPEGPPAAFAFFAGPALSPALRLPLPLPLGAPASTSISAAGAAAVAKMPSFSASASALRNLDSGLRAQSEVVHSPEGCSQRHGALNCISLGFSSVSFSSACRSMRSSRGVTRDTMVSHNGGRSRVNCSGSGPGGARRSCW